MQREKDLFRRKFARIILMDLTCAATCRRWTDIRRRPEADNFNGGGSRRPEFHVVKMLEASELSLVFEE